MQFVIYGGILLLFLNAVRLTKKKKSSGCCGGGCRNCPLKNTGKNN